MAFEVRCTNRAMSFQGLFQEQVSISSWNHKRQPGSSGRCRRMWRREVYGHRLVAGRIVDNQSFIELTLDAAVIFPNPLGLGPTEALIQKVVSVMQVIGSRKWIRV